jgi:hypothetical protein
VKGKKKKKKNQDLQLVNNFFFFYNLLACVTHHVIEVTSIIKSSTLGDLVELGELKVRVRVRVY